MPSHFHAPQMRMRYPIGSKHQRLHTESNAAGLCLTSHLTGRTASLQALRTHQSPAINQAINHLIKYKLCFHCSKQCSHHCLACHTELTRLVSLICLTKQLKSFMQALTMACVSSYQLEVASSTVVVHHHAVHLLLARTHLQSHTANITGAWGFEDWSLWISVPLHRSL